MARIVGIPSMVKPLLKSCLYEAVLGSLVVLTVLQAAEVPPIGSN